MLEDADSLANLPPRLLRLLPHIGAGETNSEIAGCLGLASHTIENYVTEILERTELTSRLRLTAVCAQYVTSHIVEEDSP
jgi:DNA-binding NarL/FixJ family response regulator